MFSFFSSTPKSKPGGKPMRGVGPSAGGAAGGGAGKRGRRTRGRSGSNADGGKGDAEFSHRDPVGAAAFYAGLQEDETFADVRIQAGISVSVFAHSFVLAGHSTVLAGLLKSAPIDDMGRRTLDFSSDSASAWHDVVCWCYTGTWTPAPARLMELRKVAERAGLVRFTEILSDKVAEMFAGDIDDALTIAAQAWEQGDPGMAKAAFLAAFKSPARALDSPALIRMPIDALVEYLSDDRVCGDEVRVFRAAIRWAVARLDEREATGAQVERAAWWTDELEAKEQEARAAVAAAEAAAAAATSGGEDADAGETKEAEECDVGESESKEPEVESGAGGPSLFEAPVPVLSAPAASLPAPPAVASSDSDSVASSDSDSSSESDGEFALGMMASLFKHTSTGSVPDSATRGLSSGGKAKPSRSVPREWVRASGDKRPWDEWTESYAEREPTSLRLTPKYSGDAIRGVLGPLHGIIRWAQLPAWFLANEVAPAGLLSDQELVVLLQRRFLPPGYSLSSRAEALGMVMRPRKPVQKLIRVMLWGGGGASGRYADSGFGGAGGYVCVELAVQPGETLTFFIGEGGYADKSSSERTTQAWPNGGRGGYNWKTGGGGGATYFLAGRFKDAVVAGAGGGGGGSAGRSYSSGGGGGGGTKDGKVGSGGDGQCPSTGGGTKEGTNGNGHGGHNDSGGRKADGVNHNGAGGRSGASTSSSGGDGGYASWTHAKKVRIINASTYKAIKCPFTGLSAGSGGHSGEAGGDKVRGKAGMAAILDMDSKAVYKIFTTEYTGPGATKKRSMNTPCVVKLL